jgi:hypothetical protein
MWGDVVVENELPRMLRRSMRKREYLRKEEWEEDR